MKAELRKLPPGQIPQRLVINRKRQDYPQSSLPIESIQVAPIEESPLKVIQQYPQGWTSFVQIARSVLVNFHIEFGSFERLKNCPECGKLFFEKKYGSRLYCSTACKANYIGKLFGKERQNIWLRREYGNFKYDIEKDDFIIDSVKKRDCLKCEKCQKGTICQILRMRNEALCQKIEEQRLIHKKPRRSMDQGIVG